MKQPNEDQSDKNATDSSTRLPLTRREMLVTIGSAAILYSLPDRGKGALAQGQSTSAPLPPGLYEPSLDHLTHALSSDARFPPIPAGSHTEYVRSLPKPFSPQAFTPSDFSLISRLVEIILADDLKKSETPFDTYAEVAQWIDLVVFSAPSIRAAAQNLSPEHRALAVAYLGDEAPVKQLESFAPDEICRNGLAWLAGQSQRRFGKPFIAAEREAQLALIGEISDSRPDRLADNPGTRLFAFLKEESIRGYYTSQQGLKELDFKGNRFYASSPGCSLGPQS